MKITGRTMMVDHYTTDIGIQKLKGCGFEGIEMCFVDKKFNFKQDLTEEYVATHIKETATKLDMPIYSTSYHCGFVFDDEKFENLKKAIKATPLYGTNICITSNSAKRLGTEEQDWKIFIERTKELVKIAEENDVILAIEFEPGMVCGTTKELHQMFEEVKSDNLMANADLGHIFLCAPDPVEAILSLKGKIAHGHIENMYRGVHRHLPLHMGDMDIEEIVNAVKDTGFDGAIAFDFYHEKYEEYGKLAVDFLKKNCDCFK